MTTPQTLELLAECLGIAKLDAGSKTEWVSGRFQSVTHTENETSVVCEAAVIPEHIICKKGFRALRFTGTLDFSLVGVVAKLSAILQKEQISIFVISTYDTDYILLQESELTKAVDALQQCGYIIEGV